MVYILVTSVFTSISCRELERILSDLNKIPRSHKSWHQASVTAKSDAEKMKDAEKGMEEAFKRLKASVSFGQYIII
jgi:hypothetical protein